jgi:DNA-binding response OmpR family regulator
VARLNPKILVAEDDTALNALVVAWLRKGGLEPESVFDGEAAIDRLRANDYAAILLDIMMPRATGFDVIEFVQRERPQMLERIVVMTAGGESITSRLRSDTVYRLIEKPFDLREVLNTARECATRFAANSPSSNTGHDGSRMRPGPARD